MSFELGDPVPAFTLNDTEGAAHSVPADSPPPATVLVVTCNHCPYVVAWPVLGVVLATAPVSLVAARGADALAQAVVLLTLATAGLVAALKSARFAP